MTENVYVHAIATFLPRPVSKGRRALHLDDLPKVTAVEEHHGRQVVGERTRRLLQLRADVRMQVLLFELFPVEWLVIPLR